MGVRHAPSVFSLLQRGTNEGHSISPFLKEGKQIEQHLRLDDVTPSVCDVCAWDETPTAVEVHERRGGGGGGEVRERMAEQQHPFDPRVSRKDPFPSFDAAMASAPAAAADDDSSDDDELRARTRSTGNASAVNLDWSIDTIAELKPAAFSPLPEQKSAAAAAAGDADEASEFTPTTAAKRAQFFDDEAQYKVLQTPSPLVRQDKQQVFEDVLLSQQRREPPAMQRASPSVPTSSPLPRAPPLTPSPSSPTSASAARRVSRLLPGASATSDLHSRCQDAIEFFSDRLRERQRKISRLQLPQQQTPRTKSTNKRHRQGDSEFPWKTPSASELKGIHPRASASESRGHRPGSAPGSGPRRSPFSVPLTPITPGGQPLATPVRKSSTATAAQWQRAAPEFSFGDTSPISPIAPAVQGRVRAPEQRSTAASDDKSLLLSPIARRADATPSFESPPSFSDDDRDKENSRKRQQQQLSSASVRTGAADGVDSRTAASSFTLSSSSWGKAVESSLSLQTLAMLQQEPAAADSIAAQQHAPRKSERTLASPSIARRQESFVAAIEAEANALSPREVSQ